MNALKIREIQESTLASIGARIQANGGHDMVSATLFNAVASLEVALQMAVQFETTQALIQAKLAEGLTGKAPKPQPQRMPSDSAAVDTMRAVQPGSRTPGSNKSYPLVKHGTKRRIPVQAGVAGKSASRAVVSSVAPPEDTPEGA